MYKKILTLVVCLATAASAMAPVPRPSKELSITEPSGKTTLLTSARGSVVLVQFVYTTCPHCQAMAGMLTRLQEELGPRGLKTFGLAFNDEVQATPSVVSAFVANHHVGFPFGTTKPETVLSFLGIPVVTRFAVPQIVIIDRKGVIRAQTDYLGTPELQDEKYLRTLLDGLLKESAK